MGREKKGEGKFSNKIGKVKINMIRIHFNIKLFWEKWSRMEGKIRFYGLRINIIKYFLLKYLFQALRWGFRARFNFGSVRRMLKMS